MTKVVSSLIIEIDTTLFIVLVCSNSRLQVCLLKRYSFETFSSFYIKWILIILHTCKNKKCLSMSCSLSFDMRVQSTCIRCVILIYFLNLLYSFHPNIAPSMRLMLVDAIDMRRCVGVCGIRLFS